MDSAKAAHLFLIILAKRFANGVETVHQNPRKNFALEKNTQRRSEGKTNKRMAVTTTLSGNSPAPESPSEAWELPNQP